MPTPSILLIPDRYKAAVLYSQIPDSGDGDLTFARASVATRVNASGLIESVASGVPRLDYTGGGCPSLLLEPQRANLALHSRDLTDIVWVKLNVTAAKTAIGADGVASGATTLTASAASGTVLQTIISASSARIFSAYVRRRTGTGTVEITQDNGTTWTAITLTASYQRFLSPTGTITNPIFGFRILTSGDEIDVDFTQQEAGSYATSCIPTLGSSVTRLVDVCNKTGISSLIGQTEGTVFIDVKVSNKDSDLFLFNLNLVNNIIIGVGSGNLRASIYANSVVYNFTNFSISNFNLKIAVGYKSGDSVLYINGVLISTLTNTFAFSDLLNNVYINRSFIYGNNSNDYNTILVSKTRFTNSQLAELTA
jgi:hypothetical protein